MAVLLTASALALTGSALAQQHRGAAPGSNGPDAGSPGRAPQGAVPQSGSAEASPRFQYLDRNGDGQVSRAEVQAHERLMAELRAHWEEADTNHDGTVDRAEFSQFRQQVESQGR